MRHCSILPSIALPRPELLNIACMAIKNLKSLKLLLKKCVGNISLYALYVYYFHFYADYGDRLLVVLDCQPEGYGFKAWEEMLIPSNLICRGHEIEVASSYLWLPVVCTYRPTLFYTLLGPKLLCFTTYLAFDTPVVYNSPVALVTAWPRYGAI